MIDSINIHKGYCNHETTRLNVFRYIIKLYLLIPVGLLMLFSFALEMKGSLGFCCKIVVQISFPTVYFTHPYFKANINSIL